MKSFLKDYWIKALSLLASIASIVGLVMIGCSKSTYALVALIILCISLLSLLCVFSWSLIRFVKRENPQDCVKVSAFTKFVALDDKKGVLDTYSVIQSKRLALSKIVRHFKWTGTKPPVISSQLQTVEKCVSHLQDYDEAVLLFKRPLAFNQTGVVHFRANTDDFDNAASPHLDFRVDEPIGMIHYHVILRYKPEGYNKPATFSRKPTDQKIPADYKIIESVPYDAITKSYEYYLINPEPGYFYRLEWQK